MDARSSAARGAVAGLVAGLLACLLGVGYVSDLASATDGFSASMRSIPWGTVGSVFVIQLALTGALLGALINGAKTIFDRRLGRRTAWAPAVAATLATAAVAVPSGAFGAAYFGSLHAPYMGNGVVLAIPCVMAMALAISLAWLDGAHRRGQVSGRRRLLTSVVAGVGSAVPIVVTGGLLASAVSDQQVLNYFWTVPLASLGAIAGACLGVFFGLYSGLVLGVVRRLEPTAAEPRARVASGLAVELPPEIAVDRDPLAEEEAELEAQFAELDRREKAALRR